MKAGIATLISNKVGLNKKHYTEQRQNVKSPGGHSSRYLLDILLWISSWIPGQYRLIII